MRLCLSCGHVGCCDASPNRHATKHHHETGHPIIRSFEPGEDWGWCYPDDLLLDPSTVESAIDDAPEAGDDAREAGGSAGRTRAPETR